MLKTFLEDAKALFSNFIPPIIDHEIGEIERVIEEFYSDESHVSQQQKIHKMADLVKSSPLKKLSSSIWDNLENTDSNNLKFGEMDKVKKFAKIYEREVDPILDKIKNNKPIEAPIVMLKPDGKYTLVAGNTRLMIFRVLGITPKVVMFDWNE